jgi:hypothetical protein
MRRLLLFLVVVVGCFGQDLNYTKGELTGWLWGKMTSQENLVVKVKGKSHKHRLVPLSMDMRKVLCKYAARRQEF